jgi:hypothetical protein
MSSQLSRRKGKAFNYLSQIQEDTTTPIQLLLQPEEHVERLQESETAFNQFILGEREAHGRRVKLRVEFSAYSRQKAGGLGFTRLRGRHMLLSCPNAAQADAVIALIRQVCSQLEGKYLAAPEE